MNYNERLKRVENQVFGPRIHIPQKNGTTAIITRDEMLNLYCELITMVAWMKAEDGVTRGWEQLDPEHEHLYEMLRNMDLDREQARMIEMCYSFLRDVEYPEGRTYPNGELVFPGCVNRPGRST